MDQAQLTTLLGIGLTVAGGLVGAIIAAVLPKKGSAENLLIDQLQQELDRCGIAGDKKDKIIDYLRREERLRDDYISILRRAIENGDGPPPPPWPKEMTGDRPEPEHRAD